MIDKPGRDYLFEQALEVDVDGSAFDDPTEPVWTTKDGRRIKYSQLSDNHLRNIIYYLRKRAYVYKAEAELLVVVDGPDDADVMLRELEAMTPRRYVETCNEKYRQLMAEASSRQLLLEPDFAWEDDLKAERKAAYLVLHMLGEHLKKRAKGR